MSQAKRPWWTMAAPARESTELLSSLMAYLDDVDADTRSSFAHLPAAPRRASPPARARPPAPGSLGGAAERGGPSTPPPRRKFVWDDWDAKFSSDAEELEGGADAKEEGSRRARSPLSTSSAGASADGPRVEDGSSGRSATERSDGGALHAQPSRADTSWAAGGPSGADTASAFRDVQAKVRG
jgi:hypothetical protein